MNGISWFHRGSSGVFLLACPTCGSTHNLRTILVAAAVSLIFVPFTPTASPLPQGAKSAVTDKLQTQYTLTQPTADNTDIVTAGAVVVLQKMGLVAAPVTAKIPITDSFKDKDSQ